MPLPWKKAGISRLVADHLNSAKQGASLVVETGFPTSIADLFVKNRDGIKRSSKNKKRNKYPRHQTESLAGDSSIADDSYLELSSCPASPTKSVTYRGSFFTKSLSPIHRLAPSPTISRNPSFTCSPPVYGTPRLSFSGSPIPENESFDPVRGKAVVAKKVFVGLLKILFLIVLALGKKQFAIGITVSAFVLLILEMLGKCICRLLKQCQSAHISFRNFLEQVVCNPRSENEIEQGTCSIEEDPSIENQTCEEEEEEDEEDEEEEENEDEEANSIFPDFSIVPSLSHCRSLHMDWISRIIMEESAEEETPRYTNKNPKNRSLKIKSKIKKLWISKRKQEEDPNSDSNEEEEESADEKNLKEKKGKIKAGLYLPKGLKKIMPNKLKKISMKKKKLTFKKKKCMSVYEETYSQAIDNLYEQESCASSSIPDEDHNEIPSFNNEDVSDSSSDTSEDMEMVESPKKETVVFCEKETTKKTSFVCLMISIILVGLEGGRFWAIVFTLLCCLVWKLVKMSSKFFQLLVGNL